jgi:hypothetical protein
MIRRCSVERGPPVSSALRGTQAWLALAVVLAASMVAGPTPARDAAQAAVPTDFSGTWLPDARRAESWPATLPLTPAARDFMARFDPTVSDPTTMCMPFGTPRNMLQTQYPLEIVQTPQRLVMVIQPNLANAEVRRIALDGRALAPAPEPSWFGTSSGRWESGALVIETTGLREDAIISENGLPHSAALRVIERLRIVKDREHGKVLIDDIELRDSQAYTAALKTRRYYSWAPNARARDSTCVDALWIDKLWRDRLQEHAQAAQPGEGSR